MLEHSQHKRGGLVKKERKIDTHMGKRSNTHACVHNFFFFFLKDAEKDHKTFVCVHVKKITISLTWVFKHSLQYLNPGQSDCTRCHLPCRITINSHSSLLNAIPVTGLCREVCRFIFRFGRVTALAAVIHRRTMYLDFTRNKLRKREKEREEKKNGIK